MPGPLRLLADPLTVFLALGAACYFAWSALTPDRTTIVVTPEIAAALAEDHRVLEGRPADAGTRQALVDRWVRDRILFHEALDRGLHLSDPRTEHRLVDKMRFLLMETPPEPSDAVLRAWYLEHIEDYTTDWMLDLEQRFWSDPAEVPGDIGARLAAGDPPEGERFWLGDRLEDYHAGMLRAVFGVEFAAAVMALEPGVWSGPLPSARGIHYVRVDARAPPRPIPFDTVRERLAREWVQERQQESIDARIDALAEHYRIVVAEDRGATAADPS